MFNKDGLFGKKDETPTGTPRSAGPAPELRGNPFRTSQGAHEEPALRAPVTPQPQAQTQTQAAPEELRGSKLIVGPDIKLKGVEITDCDTLVVEGRVEASMDSRVVQIAEHGIFHGTATMDVAEIWGSFHGTLTARKQLVVYASGRVSGTIRYGKIRIEEGGELSGEVSTLSSGHTPAVKREAETKDTTYDPVPRNNKQQPVKA